MTKYELAKLFGDVNDKFIEGAKPEAQSAVMMKPTRRSPIKIIAAASCAAAVLTGGIVTANTLHNSGMSALEGSSVASIVKDNSNTPNETDDGRIFDMQTGNWFTENEIYYEGNYYKVTKDSRTLYKYAVEDKVRVGVLVGIRRISPNSIEMVAVMVNPCIAPVQIRCYGADSVVEMKFAPERSHAGEISYSDNMSSKPFGHTLQPGEMCFQKGIYNAGLGIYEGKIKYAFHIDNAYQSGGAGTEQFSIIMTEDGFIERCDGDSESSDNSGKTSEICDFTNCSVVDAVRQLHEEGFAITVVSKIDDNVAKDCVIQTNPPAHTMVEQGSTVVVIISMGPKNNYEEPFDYVTDLDGDGIPDAYKEANPDITPEQWEVIKDAWAHERELEQKD